MKHHVTGKILNSIHLEKNLKDMQPWLHRTAATHTLMHIPLPPHNAIHMHTYICTCTSTHTHTCRYIDASTRIHTRANRTHNHTKRSHRGKVVTQTLITEQGFQRKLLVFRYVEPLPLILREEVGQMKHYFKNSCQAHNYLCLVFNAEQL